jgi:epoxyqueuosine reductase QueG
VEEKEVNYHKLKEWVLAQGIALFGVAEIRPFRKDFLELSKKLTEAFESGVSMAVRLSDAVLEEIEDRPTQLYFHHYRQANVFLDRVAFGLAHLIQKMGYHALPIPASQIIDWENQKGHLSHKKVAQEAGLGWMGRNNLLVNPIHGACVRLVTVLTDLSLSHDTPLEEGCGECRRCIVVCPAGAIKERQQDFEHLKCFEQLCLFKKRDHIGQYICGVCVKACKGKETVNRGQGGGKVVHGR